MSKRKYEGTVDRDRPTKEAKTQSEWITFFTEITKSVKAAQFARIVVPCIEGCIGVEDPDVCRIYFKKADQEKYYKHTYDGQGFAQEYPDRPIDFRRIPDCCNCVSLCLYAREPGERKFAEYLIKYLWCIRESVKNVEKLTGFVVRLHVDMNVLDYMNRPPSIVSNSDPIPFFDEIIVKCKEIFLEILKNCCCELMVVKCIRVAHENISPDRTRCLRLLPLLDPRINVLAHRDADGVVTETDCHLLNALAASEDRKRLFALADLPSARETPAQPPSVRRVSGPYGFWLLWSEMANLIEGNRHGVFYDDLYNIVANMIRLNQRVMTQEEQKSEGETSFLQKARAGLSPEEASKNIHTLCVDNTSRAKIYTVDVLAGMLTMRARFSEDYLRKCITDMRMRNAAIFLRLGGQPDNINPDPFLTALLGCYERKEGARYCNVNDKIYTLKGRDGESVQYACCEMEMAFSSDEMLLQEIFTPFILVPRTAPDPEKDGPFIHVQACIGVPAPQDLSVSVAGNPALTLPPRVCVAPRDIMLMNGFSAFPSIGEILPFESPEKYRGRPTCRKCGRRSRNRSS